ncbi:uncharacterized protein G6M90_00g111030 [Metarhizium brunneum]|uniref:Uncharacterized protein n=1 Tax=Metarhizium brunneum TaxID=500148 RepID=A0A7D5Z6T4_9HYPO|nr:hypothetical protein G6M90_00g111030 [Metarhizium brunneum]
MDDLEIWVRANNSTSSSSSTRTKSDEYDDEKSRLHEQASEKQTTSIRMPTILELLAKGYDSDKETKPGETANCKAIATDNPTGGRCDGSFTAPTRYMDGTERRVGSGRPQSNE